MQEIPKANRRLGLLLREVKSPQEREGGRERSRSTKAAPIPRATQGCCCCCCHVGSAKRGFSRCRLNFQRQQLNFKNSQSNRIANSSFTSPAVVLAQAAAAAEGARSPVIASSPKPNRVSAALAVQFYSQVATELRFASRTTFRSQITISILSRFSHTLRRAFGCAGLGRAS